MNASADLMHTLAWSLLHFLWQGAAIAALAAALLSVFRSPAARYRVGVASLALMFACFGVTFVLLNSAASDVAATGAATPVIAPASPAVASDYPVIELLAPAASQDQLVWVAQLWLVGVCLLALRVAFGLLFLERLRRRNLAALPAAFVERCRLLQRRLGIARAVRYCECGLVSVPAVIGLLRPVVLLPVRALTGLTAIQLEAVIAHELGHIKRFDVAVNFIQVLAETLFFFHPAVWWLNRRIRADREDCCDDLAISVCGERADYARALAAMEGWRAVPDLALAATGSSVAARVARLLGVSECHATTRTAGIFTATLVLTAALLAGVISLGLVRPALAGDYLGAEPVLLAQGDAVPAPAAPPVASPPPQAKPSPAPRQNPPSPPNPAAQPRPVAKPVNRPAGNPADPGTPRSSFIAEMKAAGYDNLDVDQLIALRVHGVTPAYVKTIRDMGYNTDPDQMVAMKVHGISPEYVRGMRESGYQPDADQIIAMKVHDVTPEYIRSIRDMGFKPDADQIIAMKVHGVTPEYVRTMRSQGFQPDAEELIALKVHEVTVEYREELAEVGYQLDVEEIIEAKVMGITPEFISKARAHGFKDLSMDKLIHLKNADVL